MDNERMIGDSSDDVIVCATSRLVRVQLEQHAAGMREQGYLAWETPIVCTWESWLDQQSRQFAAETGQTLISRDQGVALWDRVIRDHGRKRDDLALLHMSQAARVAWDSWVLSCEWGIDLDTMAQTGDQDTRTFVEWCHAYRTRLSEKGWLDPASTGAQLVPGTMGFTTLPQRMTWRGFDILTAGQIRMIECMRGAGVEIVVNSSAPPTEHSTAIPGHTRGFEFATADEELRAALGHARRQVERNPRYRIAVIIPDLHQRLAEVELLSRAVFYPAISPREFEEGAPAYHISLGRPLSEYPLMFAALRFLKLLRREIDLEDAVFWTLSPWVAGADAEMPARVRLAQGLRRRNWQSVSIERMAEYLSRQDGSYPEMLSNNLREMTAALSALPRRTSLRDWAQIFDGWLASCGWAVEEGLSDYDIQLLKAWQQVLEHLASLNAVYGELDRDRAQGVLDGLLSGKLFRARSEEVPIELMGMLEPAGQRFDELWITGMSDVGWPPAPAPDPFIPVSLQRVAGIPGSTPELALAFAQRIGKTIMATADRVTVSYSRADGDEKFGHSPAFGDLEFVPQPSSDTGFYPRGNGESMETLIDDHGPPLADDLLAHGGSGLVTYQSQCPFRSFAVHRLGAEVLTREDPGLNPMERGQLVHDVLERFWSDVSGRNELVQMDSAQLSRRVLGAVDATIDVAGKRLRGFKRDLLELESTRLNQLLREWLSVDAGREAGFLIYALEQQTTVDFAGRQLTLRIDRVDRLEDGSLLVIDYKTGVVSPGKWTLARPSEPQLPLYALALQELPGAEVTGLAFARVRTGDCKFAGIADKDGIAVGISPPTPSRHHGIESWPELVGNWAIFIDLLEAEVSSGAARVDPAEGACDYCDLAGLCRINEIRPGEHPGDEL